MTLLESSGLAIVKRSATVASECFVIGQLPRQCLGLYGGQCRSVLSSATEQKKTAGDDDEQARKLGFHMMGLVLVNWRVNRVFLAFCYLSIVSIAATIGLWSGAMPQLGIVGMSVSSFTHSRVMLGLSMR